MFKVSLLANSILRGLTLKRFAPVNDVAVDNAPAEDNSVFMLDGVQYMPPSRTRHYRVEPEAMVYVLTYRDVSRAIRYVELHGSLRRQFGRQIKLWHVEIRGRRDDDLISEAVEDARELLHALRNPVECPEIPAEFHTDVSPAPAAAVSAPTPALTPAPAVQQVLPPARNPELIREGRFMVAGHMPWRGNDGTIGRPSFAVLLTRLDDGKEDRLWGSDLARVIREEGVQPGDVIRLTKYPKTPVQVGNRMVQKNIWTCEKLREAADA